VSTQGARRGANKKKSRDSETKDTGQQPTGPPPQAVVSIGNTRTEKEGLQSHNKAVNTLNLSDEIPTSKDTELIAKDMVHSPTRLKDTTDPPHQAGADMERPSTGNEGLCPHGREAKPDHPDNSAITGFAEFAYTASSGPGMRREEQLLEKYDTHTTDTPTLLNEGANTALPGVLEPVSAETKGDELESTPTQAETTSIEKRRRRQAGAKELVKSGTACFALGTPILVKRSEKASWIPIYKAERGDIVVQSLPSGKIEDLTYALMTKIETVCTFDCPVGGIDIVWMGEALITAHHHIQTVDGWMTTRQAAHMGHGELLTNPVLPRVYSLCLEGGGNIIINTTATPQDAPTLITAATMGCRFEPAIDPQHEGSLTYPVNIRVRLGQISGMEFGRKHFKANEVETLPNGELLFKTIPTTRIEPPIPDEERPGTILWPSIHDTTTLQKRVLASKTIAQLESDTAIEMDKKVNKGELNTRPKGPPDTTQSDIKTGQRPPEELLCDRDAAKEDLPKPSFTPDTYTLIRNGDKASWIQLWTATRGATVVQSLPSGKIEDLLGARVTTIETLCSYECPTGRFDLVQMGKAYITAHHHIKTEDGWMTARQAADRGDGSLLTNHAYPKLYSLCLDGGGNIIINTSATPDKAPTQIEAATMGCRFEPSTDPQHKGSLTYPTPQEANPKEDRAVLAQPSYCCIAKRHLKGMLDRPTSQSSTLAPKTNAKLASNTVAERAKRVHKGESNMGSIGPATSHLDPKKGQRPWEEYRVDLNTALMPVDTMSPGGPVQSSGEIMLGDKPVRAEDTCGANSELQAHKDLVLETVGSKVSLHFTRDEAAVTVHHRHSTIPTPHLHLPKSPSQPPASEACSTYSSHPAPSASVLALLQKRVLAPTTFPQLEMNTVIEHTSTTNQDTAEKSQKTYQNSTHALQPDIFLQNPTGEYVPGQEALWELNPYAVVCGDTSGLMGIVPGHHLLWANTTATTLCTLKQTDLYSQFYKTPPARESSPTLQPAWSLGKGKIISSQKRFASCRQALEAREYARDVASSPLVTTPSSTLSQIQMRPTTADDIHQEARA